MAQFMILFIPKFIYFIFYFIKLLNTESMKEYIQYIVLYYICRLCSIFDTVLSHIWVTAVYCIVNGQVLVYLSVGIFHLVLCWWTGTFISAFTMQCS